MSRSFFLILLLFGLFLIFLVFLRVLDADELAFLTAAYETLKGKVCYRDFFLPQMPLSFLYLLPFANFGMNGFFAGRIFSSLLGILLGIFLFKYLFLRSGGSKREEVKIGSLFIFLSYFANGLILSWAPVNKPHILVNLFNFFSLFFLYQGSYLLSGIFLGMAGETRAIFLVFLPIYLYYIYRFKERKKIGNFLLGFLLAQIIGLYYFLQSPKNFLIDNIYYHLVRGDIGSNEILPRLFSDEVLFGRFFTLVKVFILPQNLFFTILTVWAFFHYQKKKEEYHFEFFSLILGGFVFFLYYLIVAPAHFQYFIQILPYLFLFNLPFFVEKGKEFSLRYQKEKRIKFLLSFLLLFYLFGTIFTIYNYASGIHLFYQKYRLNLIKEVVEEIENNSAPEDEILAFYPTFPVLAKRHNLFDYETSPDFPFAERFTAQERRRLHLSSPEEIREKIEKKIPKLVIGIIGEKEKEFYRLEELGYEKIRVVSDYEIYRRVE
ncbi:MAG: hypothetical protein ABIK99_02885 [candidate division WOR-3 bacterium]